MKHYNPDPKSKLNHIYSELKENDRIYGKKIEKSRTEMGKKREIHNLKKAWEEHQDDWDEMDQFFG